jgi:crystallin alpha B
MSLLPLLIDDLIDVSRRPVHLFDQNFGMGILGDELLNPSVTAPLRVGYYRPWRSQAARQSGVSNIENSKDGFKVRTKVLCCWGWCWMCPYVSSELQERLFKTLDL